MLRRLLPQAGLKRANNIPGIETVEPDVDVAWMPPFVAGAVECDERIPPPFRPTSFLRRLWTSREVGCCRHTDAQRDRKRSGAQSLLLPAAIDQGIHAIMQIAPNAQSADALRTMHLVFRETHKVGVTGRLLTSTADGACAASH